MTDPKYIAERDKNAQEFATMECLASDYKEVDMIEYEGYVAGADWGYSRANNERGKSCPCGGVILADVEHCTTKLCVNCSIEIVNAYQDTRLISQLRQALDVAVEALYAISTYELRYDGQPLKEMANNALSEIKTLIGESEDSSEPRI